MPSNKKILVLTLPTFVPFSQSSGRPSALKIDAEISSETLVPVYETKRRLTLLAYIQVVASWYLGRETGCPEISRGFAQSLQTNAGYCPISGGNLSLPQHSQFAVKQAANNNERTASVRPSVRPSPLAILTPSLIRATLHVPAFSLRPDNSEKYSYLA